MITNYIFYFLEQNIYVKRGGKMKNLIKILTVFIIPLVIFMNVQNVKAIDENDIKIVYLTFDDGPSPNNTDAILDILERNDVKATFCIIGANAIKNKGTMKKMCDLNMGIIPHCNNHTYRELYSSTDYYIKDLELCCKNIYDSTGRKIDCKFVRMPGGSDNKVGSQDVLKDIKSELKRKGINYVDWSVDSGDAMASNVSSEVIRHNIDQQAGFRYIDVVLMHDLENKITTTQCLQGIIDKYKALGYKFKTFDEIDDWEIQYLINKRVINK